jgi:tRNA threonylcarbamoyladenosine biosynthesis protein TsaB
MTTAGPILAVDSGSPVVSVAVAVDAEVRAERAVEIGRSSERLLAMIDEVLREAGVDGPRGLGGIVALAGPGSFTGLRVGLATVLGLHQATGVPAAAVPTLPVLAAALPAEPGEELRVAAVDVLRGEWAAQDFAPPAAEGEPPRPLGDADRRPAGELLAALTGRRATVIGFGVPALAGLLDPAEQPPGLYLVEPPPLAAPTARLAAAHPPVWDAATLTRPLYFRPPALTLPKRSG